MRALDVHVCCGLLQMLSAVTALLSCVSCGSSDSGSPSASGVTLVRGQVVQAGTKTPLAGAIVSIEESGIYTKNPDTSKGNPLWQRGAQADASGHFTIELPNGKHGFHSFFADHLYGSELVDVGPQTEVTISQAVKAPALAKPTLTDVKLEPSSVAAGGSFTISAVARAAVATDPLSEEIIAVEPSQAWTVMMDPPSPGIQGKSFPDGTYQSRVTAPGRPGVYTYYVAATSEGCVTSDLAVVKLEVK